MATEPTKRFSKRTASKGGGKAKSRVGSMPHQWADNLTSDGLVVQVGTPEMSPKDAKTIADSIAKELSGEWIVTPMGKDCRDFAFQRAPGKKNPTASQAWDLSYQLNQHRDVAECEPALYMPANGPVEMLPKRQQPAARVFIANASRSSSSDDGRHLACSVDKTWSLKSCRVPEAWDLVPLAGGKSRGEGIIVGHPDTGFTRHPEIDGARLLADRGFDFADGDANPEDDLGGPSGGHGTSTSSVIMSSAANEVVGVAPKARLVPLRVTNNVVLLSFSRLSRSIRFAADNGYHVISISLGGGPPLLNFLRRAVEHAIDRGVIVLAASGNFVPFRLVVSPAALDEVIAVAACNCIDGTWEPSSSGASIDITAPGDSVWRALTEKSGFRVTRSSGTSYAVATTAGVAALWLAFHQRQKLINRFGLANIPSVFKELLRTHGFRRIPGWDTSNFGPGILDAHSLLSAPLPATALARGMAVSGTVASPQSMNGFDRLKTQLPGKSPNALRTGLRRMLNVSEQGLESALSEVGPELEYHLATNAAFREQLMSTPSGKTASAKTRAMRRSMTSKLHRCASRRLNRMLRN